MTEALAPYIDQIAGRQLASLVVDAVLAAALQYELDKDPVGLRTRLDRLGRLVGATATQAMG